MLVGQQTQMRSWQTGLVKERLLVRDYCRETQKDNFTMVKREMWHEGLQELERDADYGSASDLCG